MQQCVNDVVAFGLNGVEFCTVVMIGVIAFGVAMVLYLNCVCKTEGVADES